MRLRPSPFVPPFTTIRGVVQAPVIAPVRGAVLSQGGAPTMAFVTSGVATNNATIAIPALAAAGDLAVLLDSARNAASVIPTKVIPTNWTEAADVTGSGVTTNRGRSTISYKVLAAGDLGGNITGMDDAAEGKIILIFRPSGAAISGVTLSTPTGEVTGGDPAQQTIAMAAAAVPVIGVAQWYGSQAVDPRAATPEMAAEVANGTVHFAKYSVYNSAPADHVINMDDDGNLNGLQAVYFALR